MPWKGYFYYTNGAIEELLYDNDKIISSKYLNEKQSSNMYIFKEIKGINIQNTFYAGEVINDIPNGFGIMLYPNGAYYIGQFEKGQNTGFGLYMDVNGKKAILGKFNNLQLNGVGLEVNSNNTASFGNYQDGELIDEVCGILFLFSERKYHYETRQANVLPDHYKGSTEAI